MAPLPSFPELMESLGLPSDAKLPPQEAAGQSMETSTSSRSPSPTSSPALKEQTKREASPTIVVSQFEADADEDEKMEDSQPEEETVAPKRRASAGNVKSARFSPYSNRRRSSVSAIDCQRDQGHRSKSPSNSSSRRSSSGSLKTSSASSESDDSIPPVPPLPARRSRGGSLERLKVCPTAYTPISSFARRRSPQASPTSPSFTSRERSTDLPSPVMLPTLPPMLADTFAAFSFPNVNHDVGSKTNSSSSSPGVVRRVKNVRRERERRSCSRSPSMSAMDMDEKESPFVKHHQAGLRISSFHRQVAPIA